MNTVQQKLDLLCCFCNQGIELSKVNPADLNIQINFDKPKDQQYSQKRKLNVVNSTRTALESLEVKECRVRAPNMGVEDLILVRDGKTALPVAIFWAFGLISFSFLSLIQLQLDIICAQNEAKKPNYYRQYSNKKTLITEHHVAYTTDTGSYPIRPYPHTTTPPSTEHSN